MRASVSAELTRCGECDSGERDPVSGLAGPDAQADVQVGEHSTSGAGGFHGFGALYPQAPVSAAARRTRTDWLARVLSTAPTPIGRSS
jgi:hypothetical protein